MRFEVGAYDHRLISKQCEIAIAEHEAFEHLANDIARLVDELLHDVAAPFKLALQRR